VRRGRNPVKLRPCVGAQVPAGSVEEVFAARFGQNSDDVKPIEGQAGLMCEEQDLLGVFNSGMA
jgi:hypothetical protein